MNILIVTYHYLRGQGGGVFASRAFINAFAAIANNVTVLHPMKKEDAPSDIANNVNLIPIYYEAPNIVKFIDLCRGRLHRYGEVFKTHLKENSYDIIVFDNSKSSFRLIDIAHQYSAKVIVIHHNYEYEYDRDNSNILLKYFRLYWIRKCEKEAVNTCDINLTLTWQDVDLLKSHYVKGNDVLFERIGVFEYQHSKYNLCTEQPDGSTKKYFIITGSLHSKQSDKSLLIWLNKYFPILYDMFPNAQLIIAGKSPRKKLKKACSLYKQIQLIDSPTNMQLLLQKANYYLCPVFLGGGLKLRIMDGLKNGLPVLTHTISARGYEDFKKLGCLFDYSDEISFKNALTELLNCDIDKTRISTLYNNQFSFENGIGRLKNIILHLK